MNLLKCPCGETVELTAGVTAAVPEYAINTNVHRVVDEQHFNQAPTVFLRVDVVYGDPSLRKYIDAQRLAFLHLWWEMHASCRDIFDNIEEHRSPADIQVWLEEALRYGELYREARGGQLLAGLHPTTPHCESRQPPINTNRA